MSPVAMETDLKSRATTMYGIPTYGKDGRLIQRLDVRYY